MYTSGNSTKNVILVGPEAHKLHLEFIAGADIHEGQPCVMHSDGGKVSPAAADAPENTIVGISIHEGKSAYGDYVVLAARGYVVVEMESAAAVTPGPVSYDGFNATTGRNKVKDLAGPINAVAAVKKVVTITLSGTGGTANVTAAGGLTKLATFDTDLATTAANFVTAHAAAYLAAGIVLTTTSTGATDGKLVFTDTVAGTDFVSPVITNATTNLAGSVATTTANVASVIPGTTHMGWALDKATIAGEIIRVLVKD